MRGDIFDIGEVAIIDNNEEISEALKKFIGHKVEIKCSCGGDYGGEILGIEPDEDLNTICGHCPDYKGWCFMSKELRHIPVEPPEKIITNVLEFMK